MYLASNIRHLRRAKGYSQDYLAKQLGCKNFTSVQKWESGISNPTFARVMAIAKLFEVSLDDLAYKDLARERSNS